MANWLRHRLAEKLIGGKIQKSASNIIVSDDVRQLLLNGKPFYIDLENPNSLEREYSENPVLSSVINLKADYASNARIYVRNVKNGELITDKQYRENKNLDPVVKKMFQLKNNPNPLQSTKEFLALASIFKDVFGNGFIYANASSTNINIKSVAYLWHVWPQYMKPKMTGKYFDQISESGIINSWEWKWNDYEKRFSVDEILHRKEPNIRLKNNKDLILGESKLIALGWALSNIKIAYESRNVIARERGMRAIISSNSGDATYGSVPMMPDEKDEVQEELKIRYGFRNGQNQFMVTRHPISVTQIDQDVRKLGLLNEISSDAMIVSQALGVPETLVKLYMKGATFENQETAERRMYQNTTIPEETDRWEDINNWLKCRDAGFEYVVDFGHIPVLQKNEKDEAETNKFISSQYKEMFMAGAINYNQWLHAVGLPIVDWGDKRITDMTFEEIQKIKGNYTINDSLDKQNNNIQ